MRAQVSGVVGLLATATALIIFAGDSTALKAAAFAVFGIGCVVAVSLVFLAIGRSEDEDREAARRREPPPDPHDGEAARRSRPRPPRRPT